MMSKVSTNKASPPAPLLKERVAELQRSRVRPSRLFDLDTMNLRDYAKYLRKHQTPYEIILWRELRGNKLGYKFRRQFPIDGYILDFFCYAKLLAIELDGMQHSLPQIFEHDRVRTLYLKRYNIKVLRFTNEEIFQNLEKVIAQIKVELE